MSTEPAAEAVTEEPEVEKVEKSSKEAKEGKDYLEMSDEEFLKAPPPPVVKDGKPSEAKSKDDGDEDKDDKAAEKIATKVVEKITDGIADEEDEDETKAASKKETKEAQPEPSGSKPKVEKAAPEGGKVTEEKPKAPADGKVDYEGFFKQVMTPFKANGRTIELKTPEEAIRLMQMGAGFGRKLQDMQPHLKVIRMLEKNDLLDPGKLSYLIELSQKKPDAIKKLIKDGGIDPLDLTADDNVAYAPTDHSVTDKEVAFHQALTEIQEAPNGQEMLRVINQTWDPTSKQLLWDSPEIFGIIQGQREIGVYDLISNEIDRQKVLGLIPHTMPFLQAYKVAGDHLNATVGFKAPVKTQSPSPNGNGAQPQVIATRTATPKSQAQNGEKAAAASPTKSSASTKPSLAVNPLQMSDDDFMKQFNGRF